MKGVWTITVSAAALIVSAGCSTVALAQAALTVMVQTPFMPVQSLYP